MDYSFIPPNDPYCTTPREIIAHKLALLELKAGEVLIDLGCGNATQLIMACDIAKIQGIGYEILPEAIKDAKTNIASARLSDQITIKSQNFYDADISNADVIILYLSRSILGILSEKFEKELPMGARIVTHQFDIPGWTASIEKEVLQKNGAPEKVYLYRKN